MSIRHLLCAVSHQPSYLPSSVHLSNLAAKVARLYLVNEEWLKLTSDYVKLKKSIDTTVKQLPKHSHRLYRKVRKAVFLRPQMMQGALRASKILDTRELRKQLHALHNPELLQQLSSYEEVSLKPFIVRYLHQCRENGVQPDSSQPDVLLSPSTPAGQVLGFILSRKDYYVTDLHINREHFSPWDVDTPPPAQAPPTLDGLSHQLDALLTSYAPLFSEMLENVETLPQDQYRKLRSSFRGLPYTGVHLPSSQDKVYSRLHDSPLFVPLCTALLRKVVWYLFTRDADNLSSQLEDYEKKLVTFVSQFLLACHREGVVPLTGDVLLNEDGCYPAHLLACVLALKSYYVGSLCVDESLFTLQKEGSGEGEGGREEVRWGSQWCLLVLVYWW